MSIAKNSVQQRIEIEVAYIPLNVHSQCNAVRATIADYFSLYYYSLPFGQYLVVYIVCIIRMSLVTGISMRISLRRVCGQGLREQVKGRGRWLAVTKSAGLW